MLPTNILLAENRVKHHVTYAHQRGTSLESDSPVLDIPERGILVPDNDRFCPATGWVLAEKTLLLPSNRKD